MSADGITIITPTGDRPEAFRLLERWVARQTYRGPIQWIVVDDGAVETQPETIVGGPITQHYIRRPWQADEHQVVTLSRNIAAALPHIEHRKIVIMEDDDFYGSHYLAVMNDALDQADLVGEQFPKYFHVKYKATCFIKDDWHNKRVSLCRTGLTHRALPSLKAAVASDDYRVDRRLWDYWTGSKVRFPATEDSGLHVGIKGMPGRRGPTHNKLNRYKPDPSLAKLKRWLRDGIAFEAYRKIVDQQRPKSQVVFKAIFDGYDKLRQPIKPDLGTDYVCWTDDPALSCRWWDCRQAIATTLIEDPARLNRQLKTSPDFPHEWNIYVDGRFELRNRPDNLIKHVQEVAGKADVYVCEHPWRNSVEEEVAELIWLKLESPEVLRRQVETMRLQGWKDDLGLMHCGFIIRRNTPAVDRFNLLWWMEIQRGSHRDQISFGFAAQKAGIKVGVLPREYFNRYIKKFPHLKRRRRVGNS